MRYHACGLRIASTVPFPELVRDSSARASFHADLRFEMGGEYARPWRTGVVMRRPLADGSPWLTCFRREGAYRLHFSRLADFLIERSGRHVRCASHRGTPPETVRHLFLDQVLPLVLNLRGRESLHASAVCVPGGACGLLGESGSGKSTLAAAFGARGHRVVSDDCLPVRLAGDAVMVEPSYPGLRLWEDSAALLHEDARRLDPVSHYSAKLRIPAPAPRGVPHALALRGLYLIERSARRKRDLPSIEPLGLRDAVMALTRYSFRLDLGDRQMLMRQIAVFEAAARRVPLKRLVLADDLRGVFAVPEAILGDLGRG